MANRVCSPEASRAGRAIGCMVRPLSHSPLSTLILTSVLTSIPAEFFRYTVTLFRLSASTLSSRLQLMAVVRLPRGRVIVPTRVSPLMSVTSAVTWKL